MKIYLTRHAQTKLNGLSATFLSILGENPNQQRLSKIPPARYPDLEPLFFEYTDMKLPQTITREQLDAWQNELTPRGKDQARKLGEYLSTLKIEPYFVTSTSIRAIQTAFIIASEMKISPLKISVDQPQDFLEEVREPGPSAANFFNSSLGDYLLASKSIIGDRSLVVVSHGNILKAFHNYLWTESSLDYYSNCGLTEAAFNPHLRIVSPHRRVEELISDYRIG